MATPREVRYRCDLYTRVELGEDSSSLRTRVLELSEGGAFLQEIVGFTDCQVGDSGVMTLALPGGPPWSGQFRIVRLGTSKRELRSPRVEYLAVSAQGYGVEFVEIADDELERLRDFLELLELQ